MFCTRSLTGFSVVAAITLALVGCGTKPGATVVAYEKGKPPRMVKAKETGTYSLESSSGGVNGLPIQQMVRKGEMVGFRRGGEGGVLAIAGDNPPISIESALAPTYRWQFDEKAAVRK